MRAIDLRGPGTVRFIVHMWIALYDLIHMHAGCACVLNSPSVQLEPLGPV